MRGDSGGTSCGTLVDANILHVCNNVHYSEYIIQKENIEIILTSFSLSNVLMSTFRII